MALRIPSPRVVVFSLVLLFALVGGATYTSIAHADHGPQHLFRVTITNLTSGQPFTPPVLATHNPSTRLFKVGDPASMGVQEVAENGNSAPLAAALSVNADVFDVVVDGFPPIVPPSDPGGTGFPSSKSFEIKSPGGATVLSIVSMLICTNDGFTGVDSLPLPQNVRESVTVMAASYDAGTEMNTEDFADIVPPCQGLIGISSADPGTGVTNPALAEGGAIVSPHPGITGGDDLVVAVHGWTDPVAEIVVERIPLGVGGVTEFFDDSSGSSTGAVALLAGVVAGAAAVVAASGWYARRRWLGTRS